MIVIIVIVIIMIVIIVIVLSDIEASSEGDKGRVGRDTVIGIEVVHVVKKS